MLPDGRSRPNVTWQPASQVGFEAIGVASAEWWPYARRRWPVVTTNRYPVLALAAPTPSLQWMVYSSMLHVAGGEGGSIRHDDDGRPASTGCRRVCGRAMMIGGITVKLAGRGRRDQVKDRGGAAKGPRRLARAPAHRPRPRPGTTRRDGGPCGARIDDLRCICQCGPRPRRDPGHSSASNRMPRAAAVGRFCQPASNAATGINTLSCVLYGVDRRKATIITGRHCLRTAISHHGSNTTEYRKKKAPQ